MPDDILTVVICDIIGTAGMILIYTGKQSCALVRGIIICFVGIVEKK